MKLKTLAVYLLAASITKEVFDLLPEAEKAEHFDNLNAENAKIIRDEIKAGNEEAVKAMKSDLAAMYNEQFETMNKALRDVAITVKGLAEKPEANVSAQSSEFKALKSQIEEISKGKQGEVEIKAITNVASIATNTAGFDIPDVGQLATAERNAYSIFPKQNISATNGNIRKNINYWDWDESTTVRAAAMIAESGAFPESTAKWKQYTIPVQKVGDTLPITEEFFEDEQLFYSELGMFMKTNVEIKNQVINGDGTGSNLTGLIASVPAFTAVASGITDASIYDLIVKLKEDVSTTGGAKYRTNFALMNIADINKMKLKKDANNNYMMPPFVDRSGNVVDGITIVEDNAVVANTMFFGDSKFARIADKNLNPGAVDS